MAKRIRIEYIARDPKTELVKAEVWITNGFMIDFMDPGAGLMGPVLSVNSQIIARIDRVDTRKLKEGKDE